MTRSWLLVVREVVVAGAGSLLAELDLTLKGAAVLCQNTRCSLELCLSADSLVNKCV